MGKTIRNEGSVSTSQIDRESVLSVEADVVRANIFGLLARLLTEPPSEDTMKIIRELDGTDDGTVIGKTLANLGAVAVRTPVGKAGEEFTSLFYGHGAGGPGFSTPEDEKVVDQALLELLET